MTILRLLDITGEREREKLLNMIERWSTKINRAHDEYATVQQSAQESYNIVIKHANEELERKRSIYKEYIKIFTLLENVTGVSQLDAFMGISNNKHVEETFEKVVECYRALVGRPAEQAYNLSTDEALKTYKHTIKEGEDLRDQSIQKASAFFERQKEYLKIIYEGTVHYPAHQLDSEESKTMIGQINIEPLELDLHRLWASYRALEGKHVWYKPWTWHYQSERLAILSDIRRAEAYIEASSPTRIQFDNFQGYYRENETVKIGSKYSAVAFETADTHDIFAEHHNIKGWIKNKSKFGLLYVWISGCEIGFPPRYGGLTIEPQSTLHIDNLCIRTVKVGADRDNVSYEVCVEED